MNFSNYTEFKKSGLEYLLDARFRREDATLDVAAGLFKMDCWIPSRDVPNGTSPAPKNSWTKVRWSLEKVASIDTKETEDVVFYEIGSVDYQAGSGLVIIQGHYAITIKLHAPSFAGNIEFLDERKRTDLRRQILTLGRRSNEGNRRGGPWNL